MNTVKILSRRVVRGITLSVLVGLVLSVNAAETQKQKTASNDPKVVTEQRTIRYSDLDLTVQSDVVRLYRRIDRAASTVCGGRIQPLVLQSPRMRQCRMKALADAINHINAPMLTAYYDSKRSKGEMAATLKRYAEASSADES
jgi:UrcA family protein